VPDHRAIQELLGVYALDAVDPDTAAMVERHLAECVRCSVEVAQHHEVAGLLANSGGESPAELWDGIATRLDGSAPPSWDRLVSRLEPGDGRADRVVEPGGGDIGPDAAVVPLSAGRRRRWLQRGAVAVAAAAAVVAVVLGAQVDHLHRQVSALQSGPSLSAAERAALSLPSTRQVQLTAAAGASAPGRVTVVLTASGTGFVEAHRLRALPAGKTYQLWGSIGGRTISLGLLGPRPAVVPFSVAGDRSVQAFAITAEHAGGVVQSTNPPVVAGEVTA
jgi:anti-sigma factor RsiW